VDITKLKQKEKEYRVQQTENFNRRHKTYSLPELSPGDNVWVKDVGEGVVAEKRNEPRSYVVQSEGGGLLRRNRKHLVQTQSEQIMDEHSSAVRDSITSDNFEELDNTSSVISDKPDTRDKQIDQDKEIITSTTPSERPRREHRSPVYLKDYVKK
jgi:hypothetical protein